MTSREQPANNPEPALHAPDPHPGRDEGKAARDCDHAECGAQGQVSAFPRMLDPSITPDGQHFIIYFNIGDWLIDDWLRSA